MNILKDHPRFYKYVIMISNELNFPTNLLINPHICVSLLTIVC